MNGPLAELVLSRGALAGSILGLDGDAAIAAGAELIAAGGGIHLDLIDETFPLGRGVPDAVLARIPDGWWDHVDVHLMVGRAPARLDELRRAGRITVHVRSPADTELLDTVLAGSASAWISLEPQTWTAADLARLLEGRAIAGALMMLAAPATAGAAAEPTRIGSPAWQTARRTLPIGADGGVTASLVDLLADSGVSYFVVGRALLGTRPGVD